MALLPLISNRPRWHDFLAHFDTGDRPGQFLKRLFPAAIKPQNFVNGFQQAFKADEFDRFPWERRLRETNSEVLSQQLSPSMS
jgi:hypothetical protein